MKEKTLVEQITFHMKRLNLSYRKIESNSAKFSQTGDVPLLKRSTVQGWVKNHKHQLPLEDVLLLARVFELTLLEANDLLIASNHPPIIRLLKTVESPLLLGLLSIWDYKGSIFDAPREPEWFIGRNEIKRQAKDSLRHSKHRLCILHGEGGVGKSTVAIRLAHEMRSDFPDGVFWATTNGEDSILPILQSFATRLNFSIDHLSDLEQCSTLVRGRLQAKKCLVIIDNVSETMELEYLLPSEGSCATIVTLRNERLVRGKVNCDLIEIPRFDNNESDELLIEIIGQDRFTKEKHTARNLVQFSEGLPLVLRLIGSALHSTRKLPLADYFSLLQADLQGLTDWERLSDQEKKVRATFEVSYQRLSDDFKPIFASLGSFNARHFSVHAVAKINQLSKNEAKLLLSYLSDLSLIHHFSKSQDENEDELNNRYQLHSLLQLFAFEKLQQHFPDLLKSAYVYFQNFCEERTEKQIDDEWPNIAGLIQFSLKDQDSRSIRRFLTPLTQIEISNIGYMDARGHYLLAFQSLSSLLTDAQGLEKALLHYKCGVFASRISKDEDGRHHLTTSKEILLKEEMSEEIAIYLASVLENLARLDEQKDMEEAMSNLEQGLEILSPYSSRSTELQKSALIAVISAIYCRADASRETVVKIAEEGLDSISKYDNIAHLNALMNLAIAHAQNGDLPRAKAMFEDGAEYAERFGNKRKLAGFLANLGIIARRQLNLASAIEYQTRARDLFSELSDYNRVGTTLNNLAKIYSIFGDDEKAIEALGEAITIAESYNFEELETVAKITLAQVQIRQNMLKQAKENLDLCHELITKQAAPSYLKPYVLLFIGQLAFEQENIELAKSYLENAIDIGAELDKVTVGQAKLSLAIILSGEQNVSRSTELYEEAIAILTMQDPYELAIAQRSFVDHLLKHNLHESEEILTRYSENASQIFHQIELEAKMFRNSD